MSALAEALVAAQRRAIATLEKTYAAGVFEDDEMRSQLDVIGCTDGVDQDKLIAALDVIRAYGAQLPAEPATGNNEPKAPERATALVTGYVPIADGASIHLSRELTSFQLSVGSWYVELRDGKLIVRSRDMSAPELLVLPVEVKG